MKRTNKLHTRNANERKTKNKRTIHANETNEKRKQYEISVKLNDPRSVTFIRYAHDQKNGGGGKFTKMMSQPIKNGLEELTNGYCACFTCK